MAEMKTHVFRIAKPPQEKKIKRICDARRPSCLRCQKRGDSTCTYDTQSLEETRMQAMKREMNDMKAKLDGIAQSLTALKDLPSDGAAQMILDVLKEPDPTASLIEVGVKIQRQSSNLNRQISMLDTMRATFPNTKSNVQFELYLFFPKWYPPLTGDEIQSAANERRPPDLHEWQTRRGQNLCSSPQFTPSASADLQSEQQLSDGFRIASWNLWIGSICLRFWTDVPISTGLAEEAINVYLRTDHILFGFMDTELFLRDFCKCSKRHCSTALVNAVLLYGCLKIARCVDEAAGIVESLQVETEKALRNDSSIEVARMAALNVYYTAVLFNHPSEQVANFLDQAIDLADTLYGWNEPSAQYEAWAASPEDEAALSHVVWGVFASALYNSHRWGEREPPPVPRLPVPYLEVSTRTVVDIPGSSRADVDKIACERYISAAINSNLTYMREAIMLNLSADTLSDEERALKVASIYRRSLANSAKTGRPAALHAGVTDVAAIAQMWAHLWILSIFQPLTHYRGAIPGFQAGGTAGAIFVASARQLQHVVFLYQRYFSLAPPTIALNGPVFVAATALTQIRRVSNAAVTFETLLWLFADLAVSFRSLRDLMQTLLLIGYQAGFVDEERLRFMTDRLSRAYRTGRKRSSLNEAAFVVDSGVPQGSPTATPKDKSYDLHLSATHVIDELEDDEGL
ncbi:hypothetical protein M409DRAFT_57239 [Zasmidium cellare ATCC 36951]|uniref:Zn(2)-C6 fungal-type domain-containing protein n=1 Tax=Zasmidium cellare ATCC 36951 TaxID=1080233 RepID=A0A6A6CDL2_ZASCE|nr:uncharacterized protein M409DRAFT_57239 [Zasmidium cellare ATCC 36951]KAF2163749.1 hypothetical protein M409DRAFT_57239 [Zasmidium cellare ATCC 36951]